jgi:translation initiation factor IF-2
VRQCAGPRRARLRRRPAQAAAGASAGGPTRSERGAAARRLGERGTRQVLADASGACAGARRRGSAWTVPRRKGNGAGRPRQHACGPATVRQSVGGRTARREQACASGWAGYLGLTWSAQGGRAHGSGLG